MTFYNIKYKRHSIFRKELNINPSDLSKIRRAGYIRISDDDIEIDAEMYVMLKGFFKYLEENIIINGQVIGETRFKY